MESGRRARWIAAACLCAFAIIVYIPSLSCGFVDYDDPAYVHGNPLVIKPGWHTLTSTGPEGHADFLPATMSLYAVQWALFGASPLVFHLTNVLLHAMATALLFFLVTELLPDLPIGFAVSAAALFAAHPMNTEAVTWISETKSVLCMCFSLSAFLAYVLWRGGGSAWVWSGSLVLHGLSLVSKTASVTFPGAYVLWDLVLRRRGPFAKRSLAAAVVPVIPHLALSAAALFLRVDLHTASTQETMLSLFSGPVERVATVLDVFAWNVCQFLVGGQRNAVHAIHVAKSFAEVGVIAGAVSALSILAGGILLTRSRPGVAFGFLWFLVIALPTSQIVPLPPSMRADRYLYFSGIGLLIALCVVAGDLSKHATARRASVAILLWTACLCGVSSALRQRVWKDSKTLWTDSVAKSPEHDMTRRALGRVLLAEGDVEGALVQYRKALELDPKLRANQQDLGSALVVAGKFEEAIGMFEKSLAGSPRSLKGWSSLGYCKLTGRGDAAGALACFVKVMELDPSDAEAAEQAATCLTRLGRREEARSYLDRAEQLRRGLAAPGG